MRLICATNRNLEEMVAKGEFREDLYYRISTFPIVVPSLSQRQEDIPDILRALLPKACKDNNVQISFDELPADFIESLVNAPVRGNIRGIEQQLSRLLVLAPRNNRGRPILSGWRDIAGVSKKRIGAQPTDGTLSPKDLLSRPLQIDGADFPGISQLQAALFDNAMNAAMAKHTKLKDIAEVLKISVSSACIAKRRLQMKGGPTDGK